MLQQAYHSSNVVSCRLDNPRTKYGAILRVSFVPFSPYSFLFWTSIFCFSCRALISFYFATAFHIICLFIRLHILHTFTSSLVLLYHIFDALLTRVPAFFSHFCLCLFLTLNSFLSSVNNIRQPLTQVLFLHFFRFVSRLFLLLRFRFFPSSV
jgi:hypothetical protein